MCVGKKIFLSNSKDGFVDKRYFYWMNENTIGDDTGDNISDKNRFINEFSAIYWAWKNYNQLENPDYIGFMHYRRLFYF
ncbi:putative glycosyl transferase [Campylobacter jejuni subsp. jejuni 260.94]|nr:putative glycosyl transferase [Campylobacter jejuni subsp. jejuni 260.94]